MGIRFIDIVHHSHADFGFTDHPVRARSLQKDYVGQAVDLVLGSKDLPVPFTWTCEVFLPVLDWWREADETSKKRLEKAVGTGNFDVCGLPFNTTTLLNTDEWEFMTKSWLPEGFLSAWRIRSAMQNDVNGLYTSGLMKMMDTGVKNLWIGPNTYNALPPMPTPYPFNWRMPDGRALFTWMNSSYCDGFFLFNKNWRQGPVPDSTDTRYRAPGEGDIFKTDEASMLKAHELCMANIAMIEGGAADESNLERDGFTQNKIYGGYAYETLMVSVTNQWRLDNDPPFYHLRSFVEKWNDMGLLPGLRLSTATQAMERLREEIGDGLPEHSGEWPDWWANGSAAAPVELSASRYAKRLYISAKSPVFGPWSEDDRSLGDEALYNLCMFDEHSFGSWSAVSKPFGYESRAGKIEKDVFVYRGLDEARSLLSKKARESVDPGEEGVYIINTSKYPFKGYIEFPAHCLRGSYTVLERKGPENERIKIEYAPGSGNFRRPESPEELGDEDDSATFTGALSNGNVKIWMDAAPGSVTRFVPANGGATGDRDGGSPRPRIETDENGWPVSIRFGDGDDSAIEGELGGFLSVTCDEFAPRWVFKDMFFAEPEDCRIEMNEKLLKQKTADPYEKARVREDEHTVVYSQGFSHPSLLRAKRILEIYKAEKKAVLRIRVNRRSSPAPEVLYASIKAAPEGLKPQISNAGGIFEPGRDQIPGSCMDYYAIDGSVTWRREDRTWQIGSRDAALVSFGDPTCGQRIKSLPEEMNRVYFMLFNNIWDTNFAADEHGAMEFVFDILTGDLPQDAALYAAIEPVVVIKLSDEQAQG